MEGRELFLVQMLSEGVGQLFVVPHEHRELRRDPRQRVGDIRGNDIHHGQQIGAQRPVSGIDAFRAASAASSVARTS